MDYASLLGLVVYSSLFLAAAGHIMFMAMVNRVYDKVTAAFGRADVCRIRQTEGETVRYDVWNSLQAYKRMRRPANIVIGIAMASLLVMLGLLAFGSRRMDYTPISGTTYALLYAIAALLLVVLVVDIALLNVLQKGIERENRDYGRSMATIIAAIRIMDRAYPIYRETRSNVYPQSVLRLHDIILKRWASFNNTDTTLEDNRNTIIYEVEKGNYELIFRLLKFDSTLDDGRLLQDGYKKACRILKIDHNPDALKDALAVLQYYQPGEGYARFKNRVRSWLVYAYVVLFLFAMPLFHAVYRTLGALFIGSFTVAVAIFIAYKQFMV